MHAKLFLPNFGFALVSAVNMVNGISVNGLGEVSMDSTQAVLNNNLIANNLIALGKTRAVVPPFSPF